MNNISNQEYRNWIQELKLKVRSAQIKAAIAVNKELILFYWELKAFNRLASNGKI